MKLVKYEIKDMTMQFLWSIEDIVKESVSEKLYREYWSILEFDIYPFHEID